MPRIVTEIKHKMYCSECKEYKTIHEQELFNSKKPLPEVKVPIDWNYVNGKYYCPEHKLEVTIK